MSDTIAQSAVTHSFFRAYSLLSAFSVTFVISTAKALAKRLFSETQKSPPKTSLNVTVVVIHVFTL